MLPLAMAQETPISPRGTVVLVHGLWMHGVVFALHRRWLEEAGYRVETFSYPSVRVGLTDNARALANCIAALNAAPVHLVGHSQGGLVILAMLAQQRDVRIGRVVMLGTPVAGSHCARVLRKITVLRWITGRVLGEWMSAPVGIPEDIEAGMLAGTRSFGAGMLFPGLGRPNDGVVSVAETRIEGLRDHIELRIGHSAMLVSRSCNRAVVAFLETGRFSRTG